MTSRVPFQEQLTVVAALAFVCSVGVGWTFPSLESNAFLVVSGISFVSLYAKG
ncbi:hypothetical protein ACLI4Y_06520 [Natrialbaceae archaeon A-CW3]